MAATPTPEASIECGVSPVVVHAASGSSGPSVLRYRPSQPLPCEAGGSPTDQTSVPVKCERLEFWYPTRLISASLPLLNTLRSPVSRGWRPSGLPPASLPTCSTVPAGIARVGRRL